MTTNEWAEKEIEIVCKKENPKWDGKSIEQIKKSLKVLEIIKNHAFLFVEKGQLYCGKYGDTELLLDEDDFETKEEFDLVKEWLND